MAWPKKASADSIIVSESVGCAWMVIARSVATAAISIASMPSAIISPAPAPTMPTPSTRSVFGSKRILVRPSVRPIDVARPEAPHGNFCDLVGDLVALGLRLGQAAPGQLGIGEDHRRNRARLVGHLVAGDGLDGNLGFVGGLVRQHRLAGDVADGVERRLGGPALRVDDDEALLVDLDARRSSPGTLPFGRRPIETSTFS